MINRERKTILTASLLTATAVTLYHLSLFQFSRGVRRIIKESSVCAECGLHAPRTKLIAAHINHDHTLPNYNTPENGRCLCIVCEAKYHLTHAFSGSEIGLRAEDAICSAKSSYVPLPTSDRFKLRQEFPDTLAKLFDEK